MLNHMTRNVGGYFSKFGSYMPYGWGGVINAFYGGVCSWWMRPVSNDIRLLFVVGAIFTNVFLIERLVERPLMKFVGVIVLKILLILLVFLSLFWLSGTMGIGNIEQTYKFIFIVISWVTLFHCAAFLQKNKLVKGKQEKPSEENR